MESKNGAKLQEAAGIIGVVEVVISIIAGITLWVTLKGVTGLITAVVIAGFGCLSAWMSMLLMSCVGEMTENSAIQIGLLKKLIGDGTDKRPLSGYSGTAPITYTSESSTIPVTTLSSPTPEPHHDQVVVEPNKKTATFESRSIKTIQCPICHKSQMATRESCYSCGCQFIFKDEQ
jgi:hypothetical protein